MRRATFLLAALVAAVAAAVATGTSPRASIAALDTKQSGPVTYPDKTGDSSGPLDIVSATISNSGSSINVSIALNGTLTSDSQVDFFIDTQNAGEYAITASGSHTTASAFQGNGNIWQPALSVSVLGGLSNTSSGGLVMTFTLDSTSLTVPPLTSSSLRFEIKTWANSSSGALTLTDALPDGTGGSDNWLTFDGDFPVAQSPAAPNPATHDSDGDGIPNGRDACPGTPAGNFDPNHNGCPGPYPQLRAHLAVKRASTETAAFIKSFLFTPIGTRYLPQGALLACTRNGLPCDFWGGPWKVGARWTWDQIYYRSSFTALVPPFAFRLTMTKPNTIGRAWSLSVGKAAGKAVLFVSQARCMPPNQTRTLVSCSSVDRGS